MRAPIGKDGDRIDVFVGPDPESETVFVVNQCKKNSDSFDEHKVMIGFTDRDTAIETYDKAFTKCLGPKLRKSVVKTDIAGFKDWLEHGKHKEEFPKSTSESLIYALLDSEESPKDFLKRKQIGTKSYLKVGSFSHGTMQAYQLIPRFLEALASVNPRLARETKAELTTTWADAEYDDKLDHVWAKLSHYCPIYAYLGAHEGDGSDFGCWPNVEAIEYGLETGEIFGLDNHQAAAGQLAAGRPVRVRPGVKYVIVGWKWNNPRLYDAKTGKLIWDYR